MTRLRRTAIAVGTSLAAAAAGVTVGHFLPHHAASDPNGQLVSACQAAVVGRLVAPSTARFRPHPDVTVTDKVNGRVRGVVDAQSKAGAMLPASYLCFATKVDGTWNVGDDISVWEGNS